ncbi:MAG: hypothetical protein IM638_11395 [Bacteroidetes bacterium]|nr:hypothetical protein [Bacteroidota bacterium]
MTLTSGKNLRNFIVGCMWLSSVLLGGTALRGQQFNYTLQVNTTTWSELSSQTLCNSVNQPWQDSYIVNLGFRFPVNGDTVEYIDIETNGYILFGGNRSNAFTSYSVFRSKIDSLGNHSVLSYDLTGTSGSHILKIQFKNVGQNQSFDEGLSYQVWLYESGRIDVVTGNNSYQSSPVDTNQYVRIGLLDMYMQSTVNGFFAGITSTGPGGEPLNSSQEAPIYFNSVPAAGTRLVFLPVSNQ